jgi:hypothetical protein
VKKKDMKINNRFLSKSFSLLLVNGEMVEVFLVCEQLVSAHIIYSCGTRGVLVETISP